MRYLGPAQPNGNSSILVSRFIVEASSEGFLCMLRRKYGSDLVTDSPEVIPNWQENFEECLIAMIPLERRIQLLQESLVEAMEGGVA